MLGLYGRLDDRARPLARVGAVLAVLALLSRLAASVYEQVPGALISTDEDFVFPYSLLVLFSAAGVFIGLVLLGLAFYRSPGVPQFWRAMPLAAGLAPLPAAITSLLHIELPILLIGLGWAVAGVALWRSASAR